MPPHYIQESIYGLQIVVLKGGWVAYEDLCSREDGWSTKS